MIFRQRCAKRAGFALLLLVGWMLVPGLGLSRGLPSVPPAVTELLEQHCVSCHDEDSAEGGLRLDNLGRLDLKQQLQIIEKAEEQVYLRQMPPRKKKALSNPEQRDLLVWMSSQLKANARPRLEEKLRYPSYGNYVDHEALFSGEISEKAFTPSRRWLVNPRIFEERLKDVFRLDGHERGKFSTGLGEVFSGVKNPFILPEHSGVRDYDVRMLNGGHLLVMLSNAKWIAGRQILAARIKAAGTLAAGTPVQSISGQDRWHPKESPAPFEAIVLSEGPPTEAEMEEAIQEQFDSVLGRRASDEEISRYLELLRSTIKLAGNADGLQQMLYAVLLESDFLYRLELGAGSPDEFGRRKLSPQEASYAISYALGDLSPDSGLREAARDGRLVSREDYRREVTRLLADQSYFRGPVDPKISGKNMRSHETTHPKLVRFFREFFGYSNAAKIFKDSERSDGYYQNPARGTLGTPGFLIKEADRVVDWYLKKDEAVFESLLTTEEFFVYHDKDNETGRKTIEEWTEAYELLKDTNWKKDPEGVLSAHMDFIKTRKSLKRWLPGSNNKHQRRTFLRFMHFFSDTLGKGRTPFTTIATSHGYAYHHSTFYNFPPTPTLPRYGGVENPNFKGELPDVEFWDYPVEQPFKIPKRKGILTHPAWLIAHSSNFHTDPIKRGRWIREKLLAGRVPDVPITVDAQVPEDPHKTLRERVELVTSKAECRKCHEKMNPLGFPFESFDDFGRYRLEEPLEHPEHLIAKPKKVPARPWSGKGTNIYATRTVSTRGALVGTGDSDLDGEVTDSFDLIERLARSTRVRQSIIRHAFRFFLGRNEMLSDSSTLREADRAYVESGGSFTEVVISLLTSDSFIYRK